VAYPQNLAKAVFNWTLPNGALGQNVLHVSKQTAGDIDAADCAAIGSELKTWWDTDDYSGINTSLQGWLSTFLTLVTIVVSDSGPGPTVQVVTNVAASGLAASSPLPNETACVVSLLTNTAGRQGRGRVFVPGMNSSDMSAADGTFENTFVNGMTTTWQALVAGLDTAGFNLAVNSVVGGTFHNVQVAVARDTPHHQRRRNS
jgi:hypothetical protein